MIPITLEDLVKKNLIQELAFPSRDLNYARTIFQELKEIGVGRVFISESEEPELIKLGKGYRGLVILGEVGGKRAALKILRSDAPLASLESEAEATKLANSVGVGPKLLAHSKHVLALEFVEGVSFDKWVKDLEKSRIDELRKVLRECFQQARLLDKIPLDHGELSDAKKHVIVKPDLSPVIIDFGKASIKRRPSNVTSFFSYIAFGPHSEKILRMLGVEKPPVDRSRKYKREMTDEVFKELLQSLNLY